MTSDYWLKVTILTEVLCTLTLFIIPCDIGVCIVMWRVCHWEEVMMPYYCDDDIIIIVYRWYSIYCDIRLLVCIIVYWPCYEDDERMTGEITNDIDTIDDDLYCYCDTWPYDCYSEMYDYTQPYCNVIIIID